MILRSIRPAPGGKLAVEVRHVIGPEAGSLETILIAAPTDGTRLDTMEIAAAGRYLTKKYWPVVEITGVEDLLRCRYDDCVEEHPETTEDEQITCPTCRDWLGLPELEEAPCD